MVDIIALLAIACLFAFVIFVLRGSGGEEEGGPVIEEFVTVTEVAEVDEEG